MTGPATERLARMPGMRGPEETTYAAVSRLKLDARRDHASITQSNPPEKTRWWGMWEDTRIVGCGALLTLGTDRWVKP